MTRKITLKEYRFLEKELNALKAEGLEPETAERIRMMYEPVIPDSNQRFRRVFIALAALAVLMLGMAILLMICHNWQKIPSAAKIAVILLPWGAAFFTGAMTRKRVVVSELFLFGSGILYGLGIWQIAQIFNYPADFAEGAWLWGLGALLTALTSRTPILPIFAAVILLCGEFNTLVVNRGQVITLPFIALGSWIFFHRRKFTVSAFSFKYLFFSWGFFFPLSLWKYNDYGWLIWALWSSLFFFPRIFITKKKPISIELILLGTALLSLSVYDTNAHLFLQTFPAVLLTIAGNIAVLALAFFLLRWRGKDAGKTYILAILFFLIWSLIQYINLFGDFGGYLGAALLFGVTAVILFTAAAVWKWKSRISKKQISDSPLQESEQKITASPLNGKGSVLLLTISLLFQCSVLGNMILFKTIAFRSAEHITVETIPVDPRDLFRGDYVHLNYPFSTTMSRWTVNEKGETVEEPSVLVTDEFKEKCRGHQTVYTILKKDEDGICRPVEITLDKPEGGLFLRGKQRRYGVFSYGIESWYVEEGQGKEIEKAIQNSIPSGTNEKDDTHQQVLVDLIVNKRGNAKIENVRIVKNHNPE